MDGLFVSLSWGLPEGDKDGLDDPEAAAVIFVFERDDGTLTSPSSWLTLSDSLTSPGPSVVVAVLLLS